MASHLPPLNSLRAFECAARHLSFTKAADELNITQSAVSYGNNALGTAYVGDDSTKFIIPTTGVASGTIQIGPLTNDQTPVTIESIGLVGDQAASTLTLSVSVSYDDCQTFSTAKTIDVSTNRQIRNRFGRGRRPFIKITGLTGVSNRPHRLNAIVVDMEPSSIE
jgi:hypothetical protein